MNHEFFQYPDKCPHCDSKDLICRTVGMGYLARRASGRWETYDFEPKDHIFRFCCAYCGHLWEERMEKNER